MPLYAYKVKDSAGNDKKGTMQMPDANTVIQELKSLGMTILNVEQVREKKATLKQSGRKKKIKIDDLMIFSRQMATMVDAGIPLMQSLEILASQAENPSLGMILDTVKRDVEGGKNFSESLEKHRKVFNKLYINMVRAGEQSGTLDVILDRLAIYQEKSHNLQKKVQSALTYPVCVFSIAILITVLMLTFIIPKFADMFTTMGAELPLPTKILIDVSNYMESNILLLVAVLVGIFFALKFLASTPPGRMFWDHFKLKMPIFGPLILKSSVSAFSRTLSTLLKSGVPILTALDIVGSTSGNKVIELALQSVKESISGGESLAGPLEERNIFPPMVVRMISVGEETGELEEMLGKIADFYEAQVDTAVEGLSSLMEPLIICFLGLVIGGIVIAMFLPIFNLSKAVSF